MSDGWRRFPSSRPYVSKLTDFILCGILTSDTNWQLMLVFDIIAECGPACSYRCSATSHRKPCLFFCNECCAQCLCVPSGTYGNKQECPCYDNWKTQDGKPKCPWKTVRVPHLLFNFLHIFVVNRNPSKMNEWK